MKKVFHYLIYLLFYSLGKILALLPLKVLFIFSDLIYFIVFYIVRYRKQVVVNNLNIAFPEKSKDEIIDITKKFYQYFCDLLIETIKLLHISSDEMKRRMYITNPELLYEEYSKGKHILAVVGHYNNWEFGIALNKQMPYCFATIYKPLSNFYFDRLMIRIRTQFGGEVVPMNQTARYFAQNISKGRITMLNFIADQSPMRHEVQYWTTFFNQKTPVYLGLEKLAVKTKQPVYYSYFRKIKRGYYTATFYKICDDASLLKPFELTDLYTKILEDHIRENPQYWLWTHRRWKLKPENN